MVGLSVVWVDFDGRDGAVLADFARDHNVHFPLLSSFSWSRLGVVGVDSVPTTFVFGVDGSRVMVVHGSRSLSQWLQLLHFD